MSFIYSAARSGLLYCHVSATEALIATGLFLLNLYIVLIFPMFLFSFRKYSMYTYNGLKRQFLAYFFSSDITNI